MSNNFLAQLRKVVDTGKLSGVTNIKDLYKQFEESGISYKDFKKQMHDYGIYGNLGRHDMARLSGMYYGSKSVDTSRNQGIPVTIDKNILEIQPAQILTTPIIKKPITVSVKGTKQDNNTSKEGPIYASESTYNWRNYSTGTGQNPTTTAGNGNGPGTGYSRQDKRGIGPDNTLIVQDQYGTSYVGNNQISGGNLSASGLDYRTLDQLGLIDYSVPSVTRSINQQNAEYGEGFDDLNNNQQRDFFNWRKMNGGKGTVEDYLIAIGRKPKRTANTTTQQPQRVVFTGQRYFAPIGFKGITPEYAKFLLENPDQDTHGFADYVQKHPEFMNQSYMKKQGGKMTQKFQQGGQASSQDAVMQFVQALAQTLQADPNQVIQAAQQNPDALKSAVEVYQQTQDMQQAAQAFTQALQSQAQAAKHGAKLNYLKALKNQCAEDEELVYFKKGGKVDCGCVKKTQEGGKAPKKESPVMKFKKTIKSKDQAVKDSTKLDPKTTKTLPNGKYPSNWTADDKITWEREHGPKDEGAHTAREQKCGGKMKKDCGGSKLKKGDKVCPKCGKVHAAGMGCSISKFKYRKLGGQL